LKVAVLQEKQDMAFMRLAIKEAKKGQGRTSPNPCVGAVVVRDGKVVGQGYHHKAGTPHAEIHAIADAGDACAGATIYVTLEPCNHTGKTPPCSQALLAAGFARVVIGMADPHGIASGGAAFLLSQGMNVQMGLLEQECRALNFPFLKYIATGLPWVVMKAGMSLDGRISKVKGKGGTITGNESKACVHKLRNRLDAILVGIDTALIDNPSLTTRLNKQGRDPLRIIVDSQLRLPADAKMLQQHSSAATWIFCDTKAPAGRQELLEKAGAVIHRVSRDSCGGLDLQEILHQLAESGVLSLLVEGGSGIHASFLRAQLFDEIYLFTAPFFIGDGGVPLLTGYQATDNQETLALASKKVVPMGEDFLFHALVKPSDSILSSLTGLS